MIRKAILVTGGAGFIGRHLVARLVEQGRAVVVLDNLSPQVHGTTSAPNQVFEDAVLDKARFVRGDVRNPEDWVTALDGVDTVVHLAAETGTGQSMYEAARYCQTNITGTAFLCELILTRRFRPSRVVLASSRAIYGEGAYSCDHCGQVYPDGRTPEALIKGQWEPVCPQCGRNIRSAPTQEDAPPKPRSVYGMTKYAQEHLVQTLAAGSDTQAVILRFQNVYGPGQSLLNPYTGILSIFAGLMMRNEEVRIFEDGRESRDFMFIDDAVEATLRALSAPVSHGVTTLNIGSGRPVSVLEVAETLKAALQSSSTLLMTREFRVGDVRHNFASTERMRTVLGVEAVTPFDAGVGKFAAWAKEALPKEAELGKAFQQSLAEMRDASLLRRAGENP